MQFVSARDVKEGMCVAEDVRDPMGRTLIARGQRIGDHHIIRMRKFGIASIFIDPNNGEGVKPPTKSEIRTECEKVLSGVCGQLATEMDAKKLALNAKDIQATIDHLLEALLKSKNPLVALCDIATESDRLLQHSVNTTVLATVIGVDLRLTEGMLKDLATGMLFHDVGTVFLPQELTRKNQPLNQQEMLALRKHTQLGFEHLLRSEAVSSISANIAFRHHETLDGSGYPERIGGDKLSPLMRIAHVVETYDSLTTPRFGLPPVMPDAAITYLVANVDKLYAREVVAALLKHIALYPVGTAAQLNTGECGIVAGVLATAPMRPVLLIHTDNRGRRLKQPMVVDLTCDASHKIVRSARTLDALLAVKDPTTPQMTVDPLYANIG
jgi:HD-GYP domain-containing protein (c-di-GMP phosphodiesterase class II)